MIIDTPILGAAVTTALAQALRMPCEVVMMKQLWVCSLQIWYGEFY